MIFEQQSLITGTLTTGDALTVVPLSNPVVPNAVLPGLSDGLTVQSASLLTATSSSSSLPPLEFSKNDFNNAKNLGERNSNNGNNSPGFLGTPSARIRGTIGGREGNGRDRQDFYAFQSSGGTITIALTGINRDVDIQLLDSAGIEVARSTNSGNNGESITVNLPGSSGSGPDTYYVRVYEDNPDETPYDIQASANTISDLIVPEVRINNLSGTRSFSGGISDRDISDIYQFSLNGTSTVTALVNNLTTSGLIAGQDIGVRLIRDANGDGIINGSDVLLNSVNFNDPTHPLDPLTLSLAAGTYFVQVYQNGSTNNNGVRNSSRYSLSLTATPVTGTTSGPITVASSSSQPPLEFSQSDLLTAIPLNFGSPSTRTPGTLGGQTANGRNRQNFYTFQASGTISIALTGITRNVDLQLLDSAGIEVARSTASGTNGEVINLDLSNLSNSGSDTYYLRVYEDNPDNASYEIETSANTIPDLLVPERRINNLSGTQNFSGGISNRDTSDIYQFSLNQTSSVSVLLNGLTANQNIGVRVIRDRNGNGIISDDEVIFSSTNFNSSAPFLNLAGLGAGTYFVQVYQNSSGSISPYNLRLTTTAGRGVAPEPNNLPSQAFNMGTLNGSRNFKGTISTRGINPNSVDYYQFTIGGFSNSTVNLNLTGLNANADLRLLDSSGITVLQSSANAGNASETIRRSLAPGVYYVEVLANINDSIITNYNLDLSV